VPTIVALIGDLMDRSRVTGAIPDARVVSSPADTSGADVVVVDLARHGAALADVRSAAPGALLVAYGPHVDEAAASAARAAGADRVLPRSAFFRDPAAAIAP
jgi:DNA-binding NarL/FixJ family response regulator